MKKYMKIFIVCMIFILCITGCQKAGNTEQTNTENTKNTEDAEVNTENLQTTENTECVENTESAENTESVENTESAENTENVAEQEEPETQDTTNSDMVVLTEEELTWFETSFLNTTENRMVNMFLTSAYHQAKDIDLYELFYGGTHKDDSLVSAEEVKLLKERYDIMDLDVFRITTDEMNDILKKYIGMTLEETNKKNLDGLYYLEEYDAYYNVVGDTNYMQYDLERGWKNSDGTISIEYMYFDLFNAVEKMHTFTLKEVDGNYQFISNIAEE